MFPERMSPALAELVPQHQFDAHGPSNCISLMCFFSLNSNEKTFSESTLFPGLPSCVLPERLLSCSLGGIVFALQHKCVPLIEQSTAQTRACANGLIECYMKLEVRIVLFSHSVLTRGLIKTFRKGSEKIVGIKSFQYHDCSEPQFFEQNTQ